MAHVTDTLTKTRTNRIHRIILALSALALIAGACSSNDGLGETVAATSDERPELVLAAALSDGSDPFTDSASSLNPDDVDAAGDVEHDEVEFADDAAAAAGALASVEGSSPGLYGGTGDDRTCDPATIGAHLAADPAKAEAWADAQGIDVHGIDTFLDTLTPVLLLHDTRVTNHGYSDARATPFQSVLQAGTAVLVDPQGVPRVRCACGNPLAEPDVSTRYTPTATAWDHYGTTPVVNVVPGGPVTIFVVVNIYTGETYEVPVDGATEAPTAPPASTTTTTIASVDEGSPPPQDATTCLSRYAQLVVLMTPLGLDPLTAAQWAPRAEEAATLIDDGNYEAGGDLICTLVEEMEAEYQVLLGGG